MTTPADVSLAKPDGRQLLQLTIKQNPDGQVMATIPVRWCLSDGLIRMIKERNFKKPYVLLIVRSITPTVSADYSIDEYRDTLIRAVPLTAEMSYISFSRPGRNEICAVVVDLADKASATVIARLQATAGSRYYYRDDDFVNPSGMSADYTMLHHDGTSKRDAFDGSVEWIEVNAAVEVVVPKEMFAPPPPAWLKKLVKAYFRTGEFDQCHFRRRAIVSGLASAIWMPIAFVVKVLAILVALFLGLRKIPYKTILRPLELNPVTPITDAMKSVWYYKKPDEYNNADKRSLLVCIYSLPVLALLPLVVYAAAKLLVLIDGAEKNFPFLKLSLGEAYLYTIAWIVVVPAVVAISIGITAGWGWLLSKSGILKSWSKSSLNLAHRKRERAEREAAAQRQAEEDRAAALLRELQAMTCNLATNPGEVSLAALPREKQTIRLRLSELKTQVCRPFAK